MKFSGKFFLAVAVSMFALQAGADASSTEITIYNQDLAFIKKSQTLEMRKGQNEVVFNEVARQMNPESAYIYGDGIKILEQNYDFANVNYMNLLNANVGKEVKTVRQNPANGENIFEQALLLAVDGVSPVLKFDYGIETNFAGRVLFDSIPLGLNSTPVLKAKAEVNEDGIKDLHLAYLTTGFSWEANYVAKINDDKTLSLLGRVSLKNNSGSDYDNVNINLVAGDVNVVRTQVAPRVFMKSRSASMAVNSVAMFDSAPVIDEPENLNGYYLYKIPQPTSLKDGQIKQVSFVVAPNVSYKKDNIINSTLSFGVNKTYFKNLHPDMVYKFENNKADGLGMPLPKGNISFYESDKNNNLQFVGSNTITNKAEGEKTSINLGRFFDIYSEGVVENVQKLSERKYKKNPADRCITVEHTYIYDVLYKVTNKSKYPANIVLKQPFPTSAKIISENIKGAHADGNFYNWNFTISSNATEEVKVSVENRIDLRDCSN